jgi:HlyD family secretion protein
MPSTMKRPAFGLCLVSLAVFLAGCSGASSSVSYEFAEVHRGAVERTVVSTGTIQPVSKISVLPLMSGRVESIFADYNDTVKKGDVLAELNTETLRLQLEQRQAAVQKAQASYDLQSLSHRNQVALFDRGLISEFELLTSRTTLDGLAADLAVAKSNLKVTETEINQHAFIVSPIDGIVLDRNINIGDTVVDGSGSSSSAIFTLAENLRDMRIEAAVSEIDVALIAVDQEVRFSLESLPGRSFLGKVETIRMIPAVNNNVVSYTVIIAVENLDGSLLPGMTCAVDFIVQRADDVLIVPNAALRFQPTGISAQAISDMVFLASLENMNEQQKQAATEAREKQPAAPAQDSSGGSGAGSVTNLIMGGGAPVMRGPGGPGGGMMMRGGPGGGRVMQGGTGSRVVPGNVSIITMRNLWYMDSGGNLAVMQVRTGISDGSFTEIIIANNDNSDAPEDGTAEGSAGSSDMEGRQVILREKV